MSNENENENERTKEVSNLPFLIHSQLTINYFSMISSILFAPIFTVSIDEKFLSLSREGVLYAASYFSLNGRTGTSYANCAAQL